MSPIFNEIALTRNGLLHTRPRDKELPLKIIYGIDAAEASFTILDLIAVGTDIDRIISFDPLSDFRTSLVPILHLFALNASLIILSRLFIFSHAHVKFYHPRSNWYCCPYYNVFSHSSKRFYLSFQRSLCNSRNCYFKSCASKN
jgi:hypothetical protein